MNFYELYKIISEAGYSEENHLAIAILGAPASGKSYYKKLIQKIAAQHDSHLLSSITPEDEGGEGVDLTVDKLRAEFQSKSPREQILGFYHAFELIKNLSKKDPHNYEKWLQDIQKVWVKIDSASDKINTSVDQQGNLVINNASDHSSVESEISKIPEEELSKLISQLDSYGDYKRVVRWVQQSQQNAAHKDSKSLVFDEAGDDPDKIISNFANLRNGSNPYITLALLIHGPTPITNLIQNAGRMVVGNDGGRDSSGAILQAWADIQRGMPKYIASSEKRITTNGTESEIINIFKNLSTTTTKDNKNMKAIDFLVIINTEDPSNAYKRTIASFNKDALALNFFNAILFYMANYMKLDSNSKQTVLSLIGNSVNANNLKQIFEEVVKSGKFNHPLNNLQKMYKQVVGPKIQAPQQAPLSQAPKQAPLSQAPKQAPLSQAPKQAPLSQAPLVQAASVFYDEPTINEFLKLSGLSADTDKYTIFCDMDGVLADFDNGTKKHTDNFVDNWHDLPVSFFSSLDKADGADKLMNFIETNFEKVFILSAGPKEHRGEISRLAPIDKKNWMKMNFGFESDKVIVGTKEQKKMYAAGNKNNILIDDTIDNIKQWEQSGGTGIHYTSAELCIAKLKQIIQNGKQ
jgi:hypothetical protein